MYRKCTASKYVCIIKFSYILIALTHTHTRAHTARINKTYIIYQWTHLFIKSKKILVIFCKLWVLIYDVVEKSHLSFLSWNTDVLWPHKRGTRKAQYLNGFASSWWPDPIFLASVLWLIISVHIIYLPNSCCIFTTLKQKLAQSQTCPSPDR